jgi:hypothetical protein
MDNRWRRVWGFGASCFWRIKTTAAAALMYVKKKKSVSKHHLATASTTLASASGRSRSDSLTREANDKKNGRDEKRPKTCPALTYALPRCDLSFSFSFFFLME